MAAIIGEELLATEAAAGESAAAAESESSSTAFKQDSKPPGSLWGNNSDVQSAVSTGAGLISTVTSIVSTAYNIYRQDRKLKIESNENLKDRYRAGIVFMGQENRDQLVRLGRIPAYYSTSNIKSLLRRGIMPIGWNSEMAIEQGFAHEVMVQEQKKVTDRKTKHFLQRERSKYQLQKSLGALDNLRDRLKTRKILEYYNQQ